MTKSSVQCGYLSPEIVADKASQVAKDLERGPSVSLYKLQCGASLATLGHITQVKGLRLCYLDTSLVPAEDLSRLVKCVTDVVAIARVTGSLAPVLSSVQCRGLLISNTRLTTADTQQLVAAMVTRVKEVSLGGAGRSWWSGKLDEGVTLDMDTLAQYDGKGECDTVIFKGNTSRRYRRQVKAWAGNIGWRVEETWTGNISIKRK